MIVLLGIGLLAGVITAVSPCILPVLPIVLAGGAGGGTRRSLAIIGGLVVSFTTFTLAAAAILATIGLPQDFLRNAAIVLLFVLAASLLSQRVAFLLERPFHFLTRRRAGADAGGLVLGLSLGLVFVPCAGPVLATITVLAAKSQVSLDTVLLTIAYAVGAGIPMLLIALGGARISKRLRAGGPAFRRASGIVLAGSAIAITFNLDRTLQTHLGSYSSALQKHIEQTKTARSHLADLRGTRGASAFAARGVAKTGLPDLGKAPRFTGISSWLNTRGDQPLTLASLRGKVVLVDFWTYSCINCIRTLPHLRAWYAAYHDKGLEIVGVHTPEFAFEHERGNVRAATHDLHVTWPVALDNDYKTWDAYSNEYWPAEYLIDRAGRVRRTHFGEGEYDTTEKAIRQLLSTGGHPVTAAARIRDTTPTEIVTPETYLGYARLDDSRYVGARVVPGRFSEYGFPPRLAEDSLSYAGQWQIGAQRALAGANARLRLRYHARNVYLVLGGSGRVVATVDGTPTADIQVSGDRLYTLARGKLRTALLELRVGRGVDAYAFTFG